MSQNSSDILCLKEPKIGENDGSQIFSIKGTCSSKISRHHQASSDVFFYGLSQVSEDNPLNNEPAPDSAIDSKSVDEESNDVEGETEVENQEVDKQVEEVDSQVEEVDRQVEEVDRQVEEVDSQVEEVIQQVEPGTGEPSVTTSNMKRNFLTGAGLEDEKRTSRRHYATKSEEWW